MLRELMVKSGPVAYPLLIVSLFLFACLFAEGSALLMAKLRRKACVPLFSFAKFVEPLSTIAVSLGLLGSVVGFIRAFRAFDGQLNPHILVSGLSEAYYSTAFGLGLSILALVSAYIFSLARR
ncbi:MotA/TolQ/ExbB proton channel family protein [candidate division NPL-UPA2 bacterium]|nr:MotA/TolQ/ExbB proton channel family protein [candidate division NPL-UPA2 bacterium]